MKIEHVRAVQSLVEQREAAMLRAQRLTNEPLRLILGSGTTATELAFTTDKLVELRAAACLATEAEINDLGHRLRSYGVALPGDETPTEDPPPSGSPAAMAC